MSVVRRQSRWAISRRDWIAMVGGVVLYALLSWLTNYARLADAFGADIRPAVAIPILLGFLYGPAVGFVTGILGNLAFDFLNGNIPSPFASPSGNLLTDAVTIYYLNWQIANGLSGLIPGLYARLHRRYRTGKELLAATGIMVLTVVVGIGFAAFTDPLFYPEMSFDRSLHEQFLPISGHNLLNALLFVPLILFNLERIDVQYLFSGVWLRSGLMRNLTSFIVISAAIPTILLSFFLIQQEQSLQDALQQNAVLQAAPAEGAGQAPETASLSDQQAPPGGTSLLTKLVITIGITLAVTVINAVLGSQNISRPLLRLTRAAQQMKLGQLPAADAAELKHVSGTDEVSQLSSVFGSMASEVIAREESLRKQVESLRIEVDLVKQQRQVSEITESDFFRDLQGKARHLRTRDTRVSQILTQQSDSEESSPSPQAPASLPADS